YYIELAPTLNENPNATGQFWIRPEIVFSPTVDIDLSIFDLTDITGEVKTNARIAREETARSDAVSSINTSITSLTTDYRNKDIATNTRVDTEITNRSSADGSINSRIDDVQTEYRSKDVNTNTRITDTVKKLTNAKTSIATRTSTMESTIIINTSLA